MNVVIKRLLVALSVGLCSWLRGQSLPDSAPSTSEVGTIHFESALSLCVQLLDDSLPQDPRVTWFTPTKKPIVIAAGQLWSVRPWNVAELRSGNGFVYDGFDDNHLRRLVAEINSKKIPGLSLFRCRSLTDDSVALVQADSLRYIGFESPFQTGPRLTDHVWQKVLGVKNIEIVNMSWQFSLKGRGIGVLKVLPKLRRLMLNSTSVDDEGISELGALPNIVELNLNATPMEGRGLPFLATCTHLRRLTLGGSQLRDEFLRNIANIPTLTHLDITGCRELTADAILRTQWPSSLRVLRVKIDGFAERSWLLGVDKTQFVADLRARCHQLVIIATEDEDLWWDL